QNHHRGHNAESRLRGRPGGAGARRGGDPERGHRNRGAAERHHRGKDVERSIDMIMDRVAGAPISWGVCEVPGWGHQLTPDQVLPEMREIGLVATEFGPEGFLPTDPEAKAATLREHGLSAVGGFVPVVLHDRDHDPLPAVDRELDGFVAARAGTIILAAATGLDGYDARPDLDESAWRTLFDNLDRIAERARERGVRPALHPHVGTMVENRTEVARVLDGSAVPLCLDTGHLL